MSGAGAGLARSARRRYGAPVVEPTEPRESTEPRDPAEPTDRVRTARLIALVVAGVALVIGACVVAGFWPGVMSSDSVDQYGQGLMGTYNNRHPPVGSLLLGGTGRLFGTPGPLFIVQLVVIIAAFVILVYRAALAGRPRNVAVWSLAAIACPCLWFIANCLWKDIWFTGAMLFAVVCAQRRQFVGVVAACAIATLMRHNGIVAAAPLIVLGVIPLSTSWARRALLAVTILVGLAVLPRIADRAFSTQDVWPLAVTVGYDVVGMLAEDQALYDASPIRPLATRAELRKHFRICDPGRFYLHLKGFHPLELLQERDTFESAWKDAVAARPFLYLSIRLRTFAGGLGLVPSIPVIMVQGASRKNDWVDWDTESTWYRAMSWVRDHSPMPPPWAWGIAVIAFIVVSARRRHWLALAVALSGLLYAASFLPATASAEMRYFFWDVLVVLIAPLLLWVPDRRA